MPSKNKYTNPKLRDEVKEDIQNSDKGGAPGQWSARKAQFMASEYKKRGGDYNTDKSEQDESQKNLSKWGEEDWQTKEGSGNAKKEDGTQKRYLPKKAWEQMNDKEKEETDDKKQAESKEGKQFVGNTDKARNARSKANKEENDKFEKNKANGNKKQANSNAKGGKKGGKASKKDEEDEEGGDEEEEEAEDDEEEYEEDGAEEEDEEEVGDDDDAEEEEEEEEENDDDDEEDDEEEEEKPSSKRSRQPNGSAGNKKQKTDSNSNKKTVGSKHDSPDAPAPQATADRLPKKGAKAHWKALPGWVHGTVVEILHQTKQIDGKSVKASKDDPTIVLKSASSGKICSHKPKSVFFK